MIKILRKLFLRLYLQTFYNASIFWLGVKIEKQVESWVASDLQARYQRPRVPWLGSLELGGVVAGTVSQRIGRGILTKLTLELPFDFCTLDGFVVLMVCSDRHNKIPYRSVSGQSPLPGSQRAVFWVSSHAWQREGTRSLSFPSFYKVDIPIGLRPHTYDLI